MGCQSIRASGRVVSSDFFLIFHNLFSKACNISELSEELFQEVMPCPICVFFPLCIARHLSAEETEALCGVGVQGHCLSACSHARLRKERQTSLPNTGKETEVQCQVPPHSCPFLAPLYGGTERRAGASGMHADEGPGSPTASV